MFRGKTGLIPHIFQQILLTQTQIVTAKQGAQKVRFLPYAFTRNGANMASTILKSPIAIQRSIQIMRAFTALEEMVSRKRRSTIQSPDVLKKLSTHSRAILRLFQESKLNTGEIKLVKKLQGKMSDLLQRIILASLSKDQ